MDNRPGLARGAIEGWVVLHLGKWVSRKEGSEVCFSAHRADTGPTTTVGNAERLVEVQVGDIATDVAVAGEPDQCVQVRAVDVHLATGCVNGSGDVGNPRFVDTVRGGVGDHQGSQRFAVLGDLLVNVVNVDVSTLVTGQHHYFHPGEDSAGGVSAMGAGGDQTHITVVVTARAVVSANSQEARVFTLATGIGLKRYRVVSGELREPLFQVGHHHQISLGVVHGSERVKP